MIKGGSRNTGFIMCGPQRYATQKNIFYSIIIRVYTIPYVQRTEVEPISPTKCTSEEKSENVEYCNLILRSSPVISSISRIANLSFTTAPLTTSEGVASSSAIG